MSRSKRGSQPALKALLWVVGLSHLAIGAVIMLSLSLQQKVAELYGAQVEWTPQFAYILRPLGAFMVALGLAALVAATDPARYRPIVFCIAVLLLLRVAQRVLMSEQITTTFAIDSTRNMINAGFFLVLALTLLWLGATAGRRVHA